MPPAAARQIRAVPEFRYEDRALIVPRNIVYEDWEREAKKIQRDRRAGMWWAGDILNAGQELFGELYAQAVEEYSAESVTTAMKVCKVFPPERRTRDLGFSFYQRVAALEPRQQDEMLELAVENVWTREEFREEFSRRYPSGRGRPTGSVTILKTGASVRDERGNTLQLTDAGVVMNGKLLVEEEKLTELAQARAAQIPEPDDETEYPDEFISDNLVVSLPEGTLRDYIEEPQREPMPAEEAAQMLEQMARAAFPENIARAVAAVLAERRQLLLMRESVGASITLGCVTPTLRNRYNAMLPNTPSA